METQALKKRFVILLVILLFFGLHIFVHPAVAKTDTGTSNEILLKSRHFIPTEGISEATKLKVDELALAKVNGTHIIIQLQHIPTKEERRLLEDK